MIDINFCSIKTTATVDLTYYWLREVKAAVNHYVLQQFLIYAETKWERLGRRIEIE